MFFSAPFMVAFQLSVTVLVLYRSLGVLRVGTRCVPHSDSKSEEPYSGYPPLPFSTSATGLSPFNGPLSRGLRVIERGQTRVRTPHPRSISGRVQFALCPFHSPLLGASRLLSFPAVNKRFQFSAFTFQKRLAPKLE